MKVFRLAVVVVLLLLMAVVLRADSVDTNQRDLETMVRWLENHNDVGKAQVKQYKGEHVAEWLYGFYAGYPTAELVCSIQQETIDLSSTLSKKRLDMLRGWSMSPRNYVDEVAVLISKEAKYRASITASFVRAESSFCESAGNQTKAGMLKFMADIIEETVSKIETKDVFLSTTADGIDTWRLLNEAGMTTGFAEGYIDGMRLACAASDAGLKSVPLNFRIVHVRTEMANVKKSDDDRLLVVLLKAHQQLLGTATGQDKEKSGD